MAKKKQPFDLVRELGLALPGVEEGTAYGMPSLKVGGKMFACVASNKAAEPDTLVIQIPFADRDELLSADRGTYYLKDHYVPYPCILVRLHRVHRDALRELLQMGRTFVSVKGPKRKPGAHRRRRSELSRITPSGSANS